ncbi:hypothetical protein [Agrilutibacter solisilvae]|uniref:Secreted protein n=1 Tax=Agrilutibacter solisilvae TaxID=2763317 RepID=A0A975AT13_9GAMM|nr:hypothetical protein [Lysobacter solisilvae]QSX79549.1 hypothetical protein I8J32_006780 [Lysobacter solisilvae]
MRRTALCLLIAIASTGAVARESKLSAADDGGCPGHNPRQTTERATAREAAPSLPPANKTKVSPRGGGDSDVAPGRVPSVRWHRFLPGMFR